VYNIVCYGEIILKAYLDEDVKYFLLVRLNRLYDIGARWKVDAIGLPTADGGPEWDTTPIPPLIPRVGSHAKTARDVGGRPVAMDGMSDDASSDDGDGEEVEEVPIEVDAAILNALDNMDFLDDGLENFD
jgi:hypothetical protein